MSETTLIEEEENNEPTPYQNNYRKDLAIDDDEAESLDLGDVQGASTVSYTHLTLPTILRV